MITRQEALEHGRRNYDIFYEKLMPELLEEHRGEWALLRDGRVMDLYPTMPEARAAGHERFPDRRFSYQQVEEQQPIDLGWWSRVVL